MVRAWARATDGHAQPRWHKEGCLSREEANKENAKDRQSRGEGRTCSVLQQPLKRTFPLAV